MKYVLLISLVSLFSFSSFALGEKSSKDCCPLGTGCGGKINCPNSGDRNFRKDSRQEKRAKKRASRAAGKKI